MQTATTPSTLAQSQAKVSSTTPATSTLPVKTGFHQPTGTVDRYWPRESPNLSRSRGKKTRSHILMARKVAARCRPSRKKENSINQTMLQFQERKPAVLELQSGAQVVQPGGILWLSRACNTSRSK